MEKYYFDADELINLALTNSLRVSVEQALNCNPENQLAQQVLALLPDNEKEYKYLLSTLYTYSLEDLEEMLRIIPPSYLAWRISSMIVKKKEAQ